MVLRERIEPAIKSTYTLIFQLLSELPSLLIVAVCRSSWQAPDARHAPPYFLVILANEIGR